MRDDTSVLRINGPRTLQYKTLKLGTEKRSASPVNTRHKNAVSAGYISTVSNPSLYRYSTRKPIIIYNMYIHIHIVLVCFVGTGTSSSSSSLPWCITDRIMECFPGNLPAPFWLNVGELLGQTLVNLLDRFNFFCHAV